MLTSSSITTLLLDRETIEFDLTTSVQVELTPRGKKVYQYEKTRRAVQADAISTKGGTYETVRRAVDKQISTDSPLTLTLFELIQIFGTYVKSDTSLFKDNKLAVPYSQQTDIFIPLDTTSVQVSFKLAPKGINWYKEKVHSRSIPKSMTLRGIMMTFGETFEDESLYDKLFERSTFSLGVIASKKVPATTSIMQETTARLFSLLS